MAFRLGRALALAASVATAFAPGFAGAQGPQARAAPAANTGTVYVSRPSQYVAVLTSLSVDVNGKSAGSLSDGQCIKLTLPAGRHTISGSDMFAGVFSAKVGGVRVDVRPGSASYVLITPIMKLPGYYMIYPASLMASGRRC